MRKEVSQREVRKNSRSEVCERCNKSFEKTWPTKFCDECHDKYIRRLTAEEAERRAEDLQKKRFQEATKLLGGIKPYNDFTFEKFDRSRAPLAFAKANSFDPSRENLFFYGKNRLGKTHLAAAIAHRFMDLGKQVIVRDMNALVNEFRKMESECDFVGEENYLTRLKKKDVLVLDDISNGPNTDFAIRILWQLFTGRINDMRNGLIVTSERGFNELRDKFGGAVIHRLWELIGEENAIEFLRITPSTGGQK